MVRNATLLLCAVLILSAALFGCSTIERRNSWPVFYDSEKGATWIFVSREGRTMDSYTNGIPVWNRDLVFPTTTISSSTIKDLGEVDGLRVFEVRLGLAATYYTDALMILKEVAPGRFLPVYVQDYNRDVRWPTPNSITKNKRRLTVNAGMDYAGTGGFKNRYEIMIRQDRDPAVGETMRRNNER
jgi:hypothetical protein